MVTDASCVWLTRIGVATVSEASGDAVSVIIVAADLFQQKVCGELT